MIARTIRGIWPLMNGIYKHIAERIGEIRNDYGRIGFWAVYAVCMPVLGFAALSFFIIQAADWFRDNPIGVVLFIGVAGIMVGFALISTHVSVLAGFAFGFWPGLTAMLFVIAIAISISFFFSRLLVGDKFEEVLESKPRIKAIHHALVHGNKLRVIAILLLVRLALTPFAGTNYMISVSGVSYLAYFFTTIIGFVPRMSAALFIGASLEKLTSDVPSDTSFIYVSLAFTVVAFIAIAAISRRALKNLVDDENKEDALNPAA